MAWLQSLLEGDNASGVQLVLITLGMAIALIALVWIFRKIIGTPARRAARNRVQRLLVTDSAAVDDKRHLVLVRRDDVEHLLLIGGTNDLVVEPNINRMQANSQSATRTEPENVPRLAPEKPVESSTDSAATEKAAATAAAAVATGAAAATASAASEEPVSEPDSKPASETADGPIETENSNPEPIVDLDPDELAAGLDVETEPPADSPQELEGAMSSSLDEALTAEDEEATSEAADPSDPADDADLIEVSDASEGADAPSVKSEGEADQDGESEDEMQRLLDELAEETKEPAQ